MKAPWCLAWSFHPDHRHNRQRCFCLTVSRWWSAALCTDTGMYMRYSSGQELIWAGQSGTKGDLCYLSISHHKPCRNYSRCKSLSRFIVELKPGFWFRQICAVIVHRMVSNGEPLVNYRWTFLGKPCKPSYYGRMVLWFKRKSRSIVDSSAFFNIIDQFRH